ncbi:meiosis 1 arrest protein isoform X1 [Hemicordylus capensis]|uniref:meiosis 1 arrest protein isoform X1 n=1 Tax=Hemicordylus capensis TaxID=884348 RepID=UPI0023025A86|nr:meiosis 1 arrest protein isoform X1 [Hemicordylus capensis]XP_053111650.1 meiosis 1 arrest protein isoform X1 [Hemicordylus capensis]XP_053111651.1 meiosis 1 arrest protein isoform X1 [Hemicordylus capensis]XP_053111652.1 meiosis 1 arrest protein isoform X1 [Hemicordylus capensis]XP_053111653.1 meiosis 1 arrest protein isoform X1 [Hemicordylus capensis]XP_053111654.1 meiosis 1 arrest protein isoform X1 [Hemicordylus capensis]XP_053111656.1 meiosis 1 arrest protein isoform X1 [Hemicordylus 
MSSGRRGGGGAASPGPPAACSWQPPRILVVDIRPPHWAHLCPNLCQALENVFSLACSLAGPPRLSQLSLYVAAQGRQECLLPLVPVRGSFARLQSCLAELRAWPVEGAFRPREDLVARAVQDGLQQFKQHPGRGGAGACLSSCSMEITVLTSQPGTEMVKQLEAGLRGVDLVSLRQLQVVEISSGECREPPEEAEWSIRAGEGEGAAATASSSSSSRHETSVGLDTDVDLQSVENDLVALETFFKGWFHDHGLDQEHLHLLLPAAAKASLACMKCDIQERLLSPALLPAACRDSTARAGEAAGPFWMAAGHGWTPPRRLRVLRALKAEGLCQSLLWGLPLLIRPTGCWRLDWEELEANQQRFQALCHCLRKREWLLLAKYEAEGPVASPFQVLMPAAAAAAAAASATLLLRSVAAPELLLPCSFPLLPAEPPEAALEAMEGLLSGLAVEPAYNPLRATSRLYRALRSSLCRPLGPSRAQRLAERPLPRQQSSRQLPSKARAAVAPLQMAAPAARPGGRSRFSSKEEAEAEAALDSA